MALQHRLDLLVVGRGRDDHPARAHHRLGEEGGDRFRPFADDEVVEFLRDTPLLIQLFFLYYVLPDYGVTLPAFLTGAIALGLQYSAYTSEVYRGGIEAVPRGQWEAATALNLTRLQTFRDVVVPQMIPRILPAMGNYLIAMLKETPVLSVVTVLEMMGLANMIGERTFEYLVPLTLVGLIFLVLTLICSAGLHRLERVLPKAGVPLR